MLRLGDAWLRYLFGYSFDLVDLVSIWDCLQICCFVVVWVVGVCMSKLAWVPCCLVMLFGVFAILHWLNFVLWVVCAALVFVFAGRWFLYYGGLGISCEMFVGLLSGYAFNRLILVGFVLDVGLVVWFCCLNGFELYIYALLMIIALLLLIWYFLGC